MKIPTPKDDSYGYGLQPIRSLLLHVVKDIEGAQVGEFIRPHNIDIELGYIHIPVALSRKEILHTHGKQGAIVSLVAAKLMQNLLSIGEELIRCSSNKGIQEMLNSLVKLESTSLDRATEPEQTEPRTHEPDQSPPQFDEGGENR